MKTDAEMVADLLEENGRLRAEMVTINNRWQKVCDTERNYLLSVNDKTEQRLEKENRKLVNEIIEQHGDRHEDRIMRHFGGGGPIGW